MCNVQCAQYVHKENEKKEGGRGAPWSFIFRIYNRRSVRVHWCACKWRSFTLSESERFYELMNDSARADERIDERFYELMNDSARADERIDKQFSAGWWTTSEQIGVGQWMNKCTDGGRKWTDAEHEQLCIAIYAWTENCKNHHHYVSANLNGIGSAKQSRTMVEKYRKISIWESRKRFTKIGLAPWKIVKFWGVSKWFVRF